MIYKKEDFIALKDCSNTGKENIFKISNINLPNNQVEVTSYYGELKTVSLEQITPIAIDSYLAKEIHLEYPIMASIITLDAPEIPLINYKGYFKDTLNQFTYAGGIAPLDISKCEFVHEVQEEFRNREELNYKLGL